MLQRFYKVQKLLSSLGSSSSLGSDTRPEVGSLLKSDLGFSNGESEGASIALNRRDENSSLQSFDVTLDLIDKTASIWASGSERILKYQKEW